MRPQVLEQSCVWAAPVPNKQQIVPKIIEGLAIKIPIVAGVG